MHNFESSISIQTHLHSTCFTPDMVDVQILNGSKIEECSPTKANEKHDINVGRGLRLSVLLTWVLTLYSFIEPDQLGLLDARYMGDAE